MAEQAERYLSFSIEGSFITDAARAKLFEEKDLSAALRILRSCTKSDELSSDEQLMLCLHILHGSAAIVGNTRNGNYGIEMREDLEEQPTNLSSIAKLISDMAEEISVLKRTNDDLNSKMATITHELSPITLERINAEWYNETGEPMFSDMKVPSWRKRETQLNGMDSMLESFMKQRRREDEAVENGEEPECDYGWLEPDGTWHPVEYAKHSEWALNWLNEHMPYDKYPEIYKRNSVDEVEQSISDRDVLVYSLNWILLDSPYQGLAKPVSNPAKEMTKAQKEFLYDYFIKRGRREEANELYKE